MSNEKLIGPFTVELKVHVENADQRTIGSVNYGLSPGRVPTREDILRAIGNSLYALPDGFALLDGDDFFNKVLVKEKTGRIGRFAVPAAFSYDVHALTEEAVSSADKKDTRGESIEDDDEFYDEDE